MFIGYYNLANFITLTGLASSVVAICLAGAGHYEFAVIAMLIAGVSDMFDGRVARHANREDVKAKMFGIQIDTVCDMVSFGITPAVIAYMLGCNKWYDYILFVIYAACGAIRLAYFNMQAITETEDLSLKTFTGVPIPTICFVLPVLVMMLKYIDPCVMGWVFRAAYLILGLLFISKLKIKKPGVAVMIGILVICVAAIVALLVTEPVKQMI
ncbi:MAG: CDP-alcohol phosphatidyltransferase family protein [Clostridia bacterium]|nr:CDP-alcohol phosphatidyltransferase family protein [Clostridia bacterium]MBQ6182821.1 CDP-alcohol phosphatidyltransferase family protein [Clostridia bacterium]